MQGRIDIDTLKRMVADDEIDTVVAAFPDMYGRLVGKRIVGRFFVDEVIAHGLHACDYLLACDMEMDPVPGYAFTSWAKGYGDFRPIPDFDTLRIASWLPRTALVLCDVYREDSYDQVAEKGFINATPIGRVIEDYHILQGTKEEHVVGAIRTHLERSGVPVESSKGEWGPGQQEIGLRYAEALEMADRHSIYKHAAKEIAWQQGHAVTFMAKWDERHAGSSCHIHMSLWDERGKKAHFNSADSDTFRWFLGGWMKHIRETFAFFAPYPASYKRYVAGSFAPTGIARSHDNRTAGFRIVGHGPAMRIECRAPGADANPYLAFAAALAAG